MLEVLLHLPGTWPMCFEEIQREKKKRKSACRCFRDIKIMLARGTDIASIVY